jgi:hypothetical protein
MYTLYAKVIQSVIVLFKLDWTKRGTGVHCHYFQYELYYILVIKSHGYFKSTGRVVR